MHAKTTLREVLPEARLRAILEALPAAISYGDREQRILAASRGYETVLGMDRSQVVGRTVREVFGAAVHDIAKPYLERVLAGEAVSFERSEPREGGGTRVLRIQYQPDIGARGEVQGFFCMITDQSDRRQVEETLRHKEAQLRAIIENEPECVKLLDAGGRLVEMNPAGLAMLDAESLEAVAGHCVYPLVVAEHREAFRALTERVCRGEPGGTLEFEVVGLKGRRRWLETHVTPIRAAGLAEFQMLGVTRDITERKRAEQLLQDQFHFVNQLLEAMPNPVFFKDEQGRYLGCNRAFEEYIGRTREELVGKSVYDLAPKELADIYFDADRKLFENPGSQVYEASVRAADGSQRQVVFYKATFTRADGSLAGLVGTIADISERKRMELILAASEARFRGLTELAADWYWEQDENFRFTYFSDIGAAGGLHKAGTVPAHDSIGRARWEFENVRPLSCTWEQHRAMLEGHLPFRDFEYERTVSDGSTRFWSANGQPVFDAAGNFTGYRGTARDITPRVEAERRAQDADARLREAIEYLNEPVCITDAEDRIVVSNRSFRELNAALAEHIAPGRRYEDHLREGVRLGMFPEAEGNVEEWVAARMARRRSGSPMREVRRQDGVWLAVRDQKLADGGTVTFGLDITQRKRDEAALQDVNRELERRVGERTAALSAAIRELEAFSYSVSHDLRAPLRAMGSFARMVVEDEGARLSEEGRRKLGVVESNARRMGMLVDDLLQLARVNRSELRSERLDLAALAASVAGDLRPAYPQASISVGALPGGDGDPLLIRQALANLMDNALKYSGRATEPRVEVGWDGARGAWFVRDNGVGFDMRHATKLFNPFERLHTEQEFTGTGIGLAIVRRVIERHHGRVWAEAAPGAGACFYFTLG
jgi:PAS domain S-box-containing protein